MVAGSPVSVQSPARNKFRNAVRVGGRRRSSAGVWAKVARFSLMTRLAGTGGGQGEGAADVGPGGPGDGLGFLVDDGVGRADGDGDDRPAREDPFRGAADDAEDRRTVSGGAVRQAEVDVDDRVKLFRGWDGRQERRRRRGADGEHDGVIRADLDRLAADIEALRPGRRRWRSAAGGC